MGVRGSRELGLGARGRVPRAGRVPLGSGSTAGERPSGERRRILAAPGWPQKTHSPWRRLIRLHGLPRLRSTSNEERLLALERASSAERHVSDSPAASSAARRGRGWATGRFRFLPRAPAAPPAPRPQLPACSRSRETVGKTTVGARRDWACAAAQIRPEVGTEAVLLVDTSRWFWPYEEGDSAFPVGGPQCQ